MKPDRKRQLGNTRVAVTQLGMGGAPFGNVFNDLSDQSASDIIAAGYAAGVRYFDTAPLYGRGCSETRLGIGLAAFNRADFVISSKVGYTLMPRVDAAGPYNSGILATGAALGATWNYKPAPPALLKRVEGIQAVCARYGVSLQAAALQFPFGHPTVASVIPGSRSVSELDSNVQFLSQPIPADFWAELKSLSLLNCSAPVPAGSST